MTRWRRGRFSMRFKVCPLASEDIARMAAASRVGPSLERASGASAMAATATTV